MRSSFLSRRHFISYLCIASLSIAARAEAALPDAVPDRAQWLARDARLARTVTVIRQRVFVGELLEELSARTGIALSANRIDGANSLVVTICARNIALVDLLAGIWSLLSYQNASWRWVVEGGASMKAPISYRLIRPASVQTFGADLKKEIQKHGEDATELRLAELDNPALIKKYAKDYPSIANMDDDNVASEFRAYRSLCTKEERLKLARGEMTKHVPRSEWTPEVYDYVKVHYAWYRKLYDEYVKHGGTSPFVPPDPLPQGVTIKPSPETFPPVVFFSIDGGEGGAVVGSVDEDEYWEDQYVARWILPGDSKTNPVAEARLVAVTKEPPPPTDPLINSVPPGMPAGFAGPQRPNEDFRLLREFNQITGIPVFARFIEGSTLFPHYDKPVSEFLTEIRKGKKRQIKWRDGMLLITSVLREIFPTPADALVPWEPVKAFHQLIVSKTDFMPTLRDFCNLARSLAPEQLTAVCAKRVLTPDALDIEGYIQDTFIAFSPLFLFLQRNEAAFAAITTEDGVRFRDLPRDARQAIGHAGGTFTPYFVVSNGAKGDDADVVPSVAGLRCRLRYEDGLNYVDHLLKKTLAPTDLVPRGMFLDIFAAPPEGATEKPTPLASLWLSYWGKRDPAKLRAALKDPLVAEWKP